MAGDLVAVILFSLSAVNLVAAISLYTAAKKPVVSNSSMLTKMSQHMESNGMTECSHCHHIVARYFIDGSGAPTCANCKPEGFQQAIQNKSLNER